MGIAAPVQLRVVVKHNMAPSSRWFEEAKRFTTPSAGWELARVV